MKLSDSAITTRIEKLEEAIINHEANELILPIL